MLIEDLMCVHDYERERERERGLPPADEPSLAKASNPCGQRVNLGPGRAWAGERD
jgi:hypothetical protein